VGALIPVDSANLNVACRSQRDFEPLAGFTPHIVVFFCCHILSVRAFTLSPAKTEDIKMKTIVTILTEGYADWEIGLLTAAAHGFYDVLTLFATPGGKPVISAGGLKVTPDMAIETIDPAALDALVVCGGSSWKRPGAPDIAKIVNAVHNAGKLVGAICDGTLAVARTGLLDHLAHTSNGKGYLDESGYGGAKRYLDVPRAVSDQYVVTAPATAPVTFMAKVLEGIGVGDTQLNYYVGLYGAEHEATKQAA